MIAITFKVRSRPILRYGPNLRSRTPLRRTSRIRMRSSRQRRAQRQWDRTTATKIAAGMTCELLGPNVCQRPGVEGCHWLPAAQGGLWVPANHKLGCRQHHQFSHIHPARAYKLGMLLRKHEASSAIGGTKP